MLTFLGSHNGGVNGFFLLIPQNCHIHCRWQIAEYF